MKIFTEKIVHWHVQNYPHLDYENYLLQLPELQDQVMNRRQVVDVCWQLKASKLCQHSKLQSSSDKITTMQKQEASVIPEINCLKSHTSVFELVLQNPEEKKQLNSDQIQDEPAQTSNFHSYLKRKMKIKKIRMLNTYMR